MSSCSDGDGPPDLADSSDADDGWKQGPYHDEQEQPGHAQATGASSSACEVAEVQERGYNLMPHDGCVVLERLGDVSKVCHTTTLEKVALPPGNWSLVFANGFAVVEEPQSGDLILCEDLLTRHLFLSELDGMMYVKDKQRQETYTCITRLRMYKPCTAT